MKFAIGEVVIVVCCDHPEAQHLLGEEVEVIGHHPPPWWDSEGLNRYPYKVRDPVNRVWYCEEVCLRKRPPYPGCEPTTWGDSLWAPGKLRPRLPVREAAEIPEHVWRGL